MAMKGIVGNLPAGHQRTRPVVTDWEGRRVWVESSSQSIVAPVDQPGSADISNKSVDTSNWAASSVMMQRYFPETPSFVHNDLLRNYPLTRKRAIQRRFDKGVACLLYWTSGRVLSLVLADGTGSLLPKRQEPELAERG